METDPTEIIKKKFDIKEHMTEQQKEELDQEKNKHNPNANGKTSRKNQKKEKKNQKNQNKETIELDFTKCDFPIPYSEQRLVEDWYEFNDSSVTPIYPGTLQSKFGGNNTDGSAYMLVYRSKQMNQLPAVKTGEDVVMNGQEVPKPKLPSYQQEFNDLKNAQYEKDREIFNDLKE